MAFTPVGSEFRINTTTAGNQQYANVAMDADGDFVVAWVAYQDGSGGGIYAQRYNSSGVAQGSEFRVNVTTANDQLAPAIAMDPNGNFVVAWSSASQDGSGDGVYIRKYDNTGTATTGEIRANTYTTANQNDPSVAMDNSGNFVVSWTSGASSGSGQQDGSQYGVYAQRFDSSATKVGGEFKVNTHTANSQGTSAVAMDADGDFVVTWTSYLQDGSVAGVYAQRYNASGVAQGSEFRVNQVTANAQFFSHVAMDDAGNFVVAWGSDGQDGSGNGVYARRYNSSGTALGNEFRVNTYTANHQYFANIAMSGSGEFVIQWSSQGQDGSGYGIYAQRYTSAGATDGAEFRANTYTTSSQLIGTSAMDNNGNFILAWSSQGQDGSGYGNYAQRYAVNNPPVASVGGPYSVTEGQSLNLNASGSSDPDAGQTLTYSWDVNGDSVFGDATGVTPTLTWSQLLALGIQDGANLYSNVRVRVTDNLGASTTSSATTLTVVNAPPTPGVAGPAFGVRGQPRGYTLTAADPSPVDQAANFTFYIDWDGDTIYDQTVVAASGTVVYHEYYSSGAYTIRVAASDKDGGLSPGVSTLSLNIYDYQSQVDPLNPSLTNFVWGGSSVNDALIIFIGGGAGGSPTGPDIVQFFNFADPGAGLLTFSGITGRAIFYGNGGSDELYNIDIGSGYSKVLEIYGGDGDDIIDGGPQNDTIVGGLGNDVVVGEGGNDYLFGNEDFDVVIGLGGDDYIDGGSGDDILVGDEPGTPGNDTIFGSAGRDIIFAVLGSDLISGGTGDDLIISGDGDFGFFGDNLIAIRDEWLSGNSYATRVANISGTGPGGANGTAYIQPGVNVFDDGAVDTVYGNEDNDWFIVSLTQDITPDVNIGVEIKTGV